MAGETPVAIRADDGGCRFRLRVRPHAGRDAVLGTYGDAVRIAVREAPERGRANRSVCELLARALEVPLSTVSIVLGKGSPDKWVRIEGLEPEECRRRLGLLLAGRA